MEQSADIGESLVVLEKEVRMDQQQEEEMEEAQSALAAVAPERTPVHVRIDNGLAEGAHISTQDGSVDLTYTKHFVHTSLWKLGKFNKLLILSLMRIFRNTAPPPKKLSFMILKEREEEVHATILYA